MMAPLIPMGRDSALRATSFAGFHKSRGCDIDSVLFISAEVR
jgi:hypothetical protein